MLGATDHEKNLSGHERSAEKHCVQQGCITFSSSWSPTSPHVKRRLPISRAQHFAAVRPPGQFRSQQPPKRRKSARDPPSCSTPGVGEFRSARRNLFLHRLQQPSLSSVSSVSDTRQRSLLRFCCRELNNSSAFFLAPRTKTCSWNLVCVTHVKQLSDPAKKYQIC